MKPRMSALTRKSEEKLLNAMSLEDLRSMAILSNRVSQGLQPVCKFREAEQGMITKYGFTMKKAKAS